MRTRSLCIAILCVTAAILDAVAQNAASASGYAEAKGARLFYEVDGNGHPLVLLHGGGVDRRMWETQVPELAKHYQVIRYDLRGTGKSDPDRPPFSNTDDLHAVLRALKIGKAHILGLSRGGGIAADFTLEHPEMVSALVLVSANLGNTPRAYREMMVKAAQIAKDGDMQRAIDTWWNDPHQGPRKDAAGRQRVRELLADNLPTFLPRFLAPPAQARAEPEPRPTRDRLAEFRVPTLVIAGERDAPDARANYERWAKGIPGAKIARVPGAAHLVNVDQPEHFTRLVLDFLTSVKP